MRESLLVGQRKKWKYRNWFKSLQSLREILLPILGPTATLCDIERKADRYPSRPQTVLDAVGHSKCLRPITGLSVRAIVIIVVVVIIFERKYCF